jgi:hypothetical protein
MITHVREVQSQAFLDAEPTGLVESGGRAGDELFVLPFFSGVLQQ